MQSASQWIVLARILRPQGRKGEVLADLFTDFPGRFVRQPRVWLAPQGFADSPSAASTSTEPSPPLQLAEVASHWLPVGKNAGRIVLCFAGIDSIELAGTLAGKEVLVPLSERTPLDSDATYITDLIGCTVYDREQPLGTVASVDFPTTPDGARRLEDAAPLLAITAPNGDEILVPFVRAFLVALDPAAKSIRMALPEGLAELNLQPSRDAER
ncbi:MAG: ribosome maturation factor RimM [Acidobacteriaceae bacterium]